MKVISLNLYDVEYLDTGPSASWEVDFESGLYVHGHANLHNDEHWFEVSGYMHAEGVEIEYDREKLEKLIINTLKNL